MQNVVVSWEFSFYLIHCVYSFLLHFFLCGMYVIYYVHVLRVSRLIGFASITCPSWELKKKPIFHSQHKNIYHFFFTFPFIISMQKLLLSHYYISFVYMHIWYQLCCVSIYDMIPFKGLILTCMREREREFL